MSDPFAFDHKRLFNEPTMELAFLKLKLQLIQYGFCDSIMDLELLDV